MQEVHVESRRRGVSFSFQLVYADTQGHFRRKELGTVINGHARRDDQRALGDLRFVQGDFIDVAIYPDSRGPMMDRAAPHGSLSTRRVSLGSSAIRSR